MKKVSEDRRKSRAKAHLGWEKIVRESNGACEATLHRLAVQFPKLSPMELKTSVLLRDFLQSWKIAEILNITEGTVEKHRSQIHKKLSLSSSVQLSSFFAQF